MIDDKLILQTELCNKKIQNTKFHLLKKKPVMKNREMRAKLWTI